MAYRISATTDRDKKLLDLIRDLAWKQHMGVSETIRESLLAKLYGGRQHWPEEYR